MGHGPPVPTVDSAGLQDIFILGRVPYPGRLVDDTQELTEGRLFRRNLVGWKETSRPYSPLCYTLRWYSHGRNRMDTGHDSQEVCPSREDDVMPSNVVGRMKGPEPV